MTTTEQIFICPISDVTDGVASDPIPEGCRDHCAALWGDAVRAESLGVDHDIYKEVSHNPYSEVCFRVPLDTIFSFDALMVDKDDKREYVVIDACTGCEQNVSEQGYSFTCPYQAANETSDLYE